MKGQQLQFWLSKELDPCPEIQYLEVVHSQKRVVLIEIAPAVGVPTKFKSVAYLRIGEATPKLSDHPEKEKALWRKLQTFSWEKAPAATYLSADRVVDLIDVDQCCKLMGEPQPRDIEDAISFLSDNRLILPDVGSKWNVTNKCAVLFARRLSDFQSLERRQIRLIQYGDEGRVNAIKELPIPAGYALSFESLIDAVVAMVSREDIGTLRLKRELVPRVAIREAVANAMIHQDMLITASVPMVEVFPNRVEIRNPGEPLIETARFINAPPQSRNEDIASLMRRMDICEERGSGIDRIVSIAEENNLPPPEFSRQDGMTRVVLYGPQPVTAWAKSDLVRACFQHACLLVQNGKRATNASLRARLMLEDTQSAQVSRIFKDALKEGCIKLADPAAPKGGYVPDFKAG
ncbi:MAG: ATP-binding protein [Hyphomicrobiales bacterium]|nr:ATP-binding protein [Hyphomicrobiales bacterium]